MLMKNTMKKHIITVKIRLSLLFCGIFSSSSGNDFQNIRMSSIPHAFLIFHSQTDVQTGAVRNFRYRQHPLSIHYHLHLKAVIKFCRDVIITQSSFFCQRFSFEIFPMIRLKSTIASSSSHNLSHPEGLPDTGSALEAAEKEMPAEGSPRGNAPGRWPGTPRLFRGLPARRRS